MPRVKVRHVVIGDSTHPDCPLCEREASAKSGQERATPTTKPHPPDCPCRFCAPASSYVLAPLQPWEDEIIDIAVGQADGSLKTTASYRVERDGSMTWLTPDGRPPKSFMS
jgi:hypothetical protein